MDKRTFQVVAAIALAALVGAAGLTVMATGSDSDGEGGGFAGRLHELGRHLHGDDHHMDHMARLIEELELTPDQQQRLEKLHEIFGAYHRQGSGSMIELHNNLVEQFERGRLETDEIRRTIDEHVEQIRETAYAGMDELVALVNGLDARQREIMMTHLQGNQAGHDSHDP
jgi:Spy/CpxP family protein refolding chaperone